MERAGPDVCVLHHFRCGGARQDTLFRFRLLDSVPGIRFCDC